MPLAVTNVEFSIFLHISAVVVGFGSTFSESVMFPVAMKMSARNLPFVHRLQLVINQFFAIPAAIVVAATGIYQVDKGGFDYGDFWLQGTIKDLPPTYQKLGRAEGIVGSIMGILLILAIYFMVTKPGLG
jgi:uncharacterized membrane protein